jgi:thiol-disulfide isomerase/thioredoxin
MSKVEKQKMRTSKKSDLSDRVKDKEKAYVLFYATWCPFSQRFLPIFQEYAKKNPEECLSIIVDEDPEVCEEYAIEYYPTVITFKKGKAYKRLNAEPGVGLDKRQLKDLTEEE